jgi:hypothetical protein
MREVRTFPNGTLLFDHRNKLGFEGVVSKRLASRYSSDPSRNWVKTKCPDWKRDNAGRHKLFEGPREPEPAEGPEDAREKARRACQGHRAVAIAAAKPRHGP